MAEQFECQGDACGGSCDWIFQRVRVFPRISGGTRVEWYMHPEFRDPEPHAFQLEVSTHYGSNPDPDEVELGWLPVGPPVENVWYLTDATQRVWGLQQWTHYRVHVTTPVGTYHSAPAPCLGVWNFREWRHAQAILRNEKLIMRRGEGQDGYLLKRRIGGVPCPVCLDSMTDEVRNAQCSVCWGVGWVGGYYDAVGCIYALLKEKPVHARIEPEGPRGGGGDVVVEARMLAIPQLSELDVWVDKNTDMRYFVHTLNTLVDKRGVPLVYEPVELHLAPFTHQIYQFPIADEVPDIT